MIQFHNIARALICSQDKVLLARAKHASNTFLPGGHIELGESAEDTIIREINEEAGFNAQIVRFCGAIEHLWPEQTKENHEISLIFLTEIIGLDDSIKVHTKEPHLELFWAPISQLKRLNLQPAPLIELIKNRKDTSSYWGSTLKNAS